MSGMAETEVWAGGLTVARAPMGFVEQVTLDQWLKGMEAGDGGAYLWPRTPVRNIQAEIWRRVGASDYNTRDSRCRAMSIMETIQEMRENSLLPIGGIQVLDLFCGDAVILWQIRRLLQGVECYGVDLRAGEYRFHETARRAGVHLYRVAVQRMVREPAPQRIDVGIMLNTWRGWGRADLPEEEKDLPQRVDRWCYDNLNYLFCTATPGQVGEMQARGWWTFEVGPGEDESRMICAFPSGAPEEIRRWAGA